MLAWMIYATLVSVLLAGAGALLEDHSPWLVGRRRMVWLGVIIGSLLLAVAVTVVQGGPRTSVTPVSQQGSGGSEASPPGPADILAGTLPDVPAPVETRTNLSADARSPSLDIVLLIAWLSCSALCMVMLIASAWRVSRMRRSWRESVIAGVPVLVSHDVGPAVIGLVHHGIVVPSWVEALRDDEQRTVMTHEREHVRAGDPLLLWSATLLVSLAPWNAALWYALRRLRHAIEMDCDARVLRSRPDARAYCTLLLDVGERTLAGVAPMAALAEPATLLERRIEAMTSTARVRRMRVVSSGVAALLLIAAACWAPRPEVAPRARIASLVAELNSLLAKDSSQHFLSATERATAARVASTNLSASIRAEMDHRVDSLARVDFPEAFTTRDDAIVVTVLFDATGKIVRSFANHYTVDEVFDVVPGTADRPLAMRSSTYLLSRTMGASFPKLTSSGSQTMSDAPHAIFVFGELAADAQIQRELSRDSLLTLASRYESTTVHGISSGTSFVALRFDRNGTVIAHSNVGYSPNTIRPSITSMRQSMFGIESTQENDEARVVLLRAGEPDAMPGPLYVLVVRPRG